MLKKLKKIKVTTLTYLLIETLLVFAVIVLKLFYYEQYLFIDNINFVYFFFLALIGFNIYYITSTIRSIEVIAQRNYQDIKSVLGADISEGLLFGQVGLIMYDSNKEIIWTSELFDDRNIKCLGKDVIVLFPELKSFFTEGPKVPTELRCNYNNRIYNVLHMRELNVLVFKDVSELEDLYELRKNEFPVFLTLSIDNLTDIANLAKDERFTQVELDIRKSILEWAKKYDVFIKRIKDDIYLILTNEKKYEEIVYDKFDIVEKVRELTRENSVPITISIGVGRGVTDYLALSELSSSAIDVALSRGGGQVVINNYGSHMEFYGGTEDIVAKKNSVRSRVLAQSLYAHIQTNSTILIVPHDVADFDAIGAALGVYTLAKYAKKNTHIVCELSNMEMKTRFAIRDIFSKEEIDDIFISEEKALQLNNDNTLVILVDVNRSKLTTCPKLIEVAKNVAVIDHHRRAEDAIDNPVFAIIETTASSTGEIVIELLKFNQNKIEVDNRVATIMFTGLLLDTNGFKSSTSSYTFEAAMNLKEYGANVVAANNYLKDEYEEYLLKTKIMNNAETIHFGIVVASATEDIIIDRTMLAKVGKEAMGVKGIKAIFVVGRISQTDIGISARSDGTINVQMILEKMGGGGHFSMAAAQIKDKTLQDVKAELIKLLDLYINEVRND